MEGSKTFSRGPEQRPTVGTLGHGGVTPTDVALFHRAFPVLSESLQRQRATRVHCRFIFLLAVSAYIALASMTCAG